MATVNEENLANLIKERRLELGLTVEEAAHRAGVGVKTWYRYESGNSIRTDKCKGVCKALNWAKLPGQAEIDISEYEKMNAWSSFIALNYGTAAAIIFATGSDILLDYIKDELEELSSYPKGTHVGQLPYSWLKEYLPQQFLMEYDYTFVYRLQAALEHLRKCASNGLDMIAYSVINVLLLYLSVEAGSFLTDMDENVKKLIEEDYEEVDEDEFEPMYSEDWVFDLFDDARDIGFVLKYYDVIDRSSRYHIDHWFDD